MTLSSTTSKVSYNGDGATASFSINFVFWDSEDLEVTLRAADGTETTWVEGTQYTVSGGNGSTGTLTVKTTPTDYTPASGEKLVIRDKQSELQEDSLPLSGSFPSTVVEQRLDKITRLIQIHSEEIARSILLPVSTSLSGLVLPEPGAGELLRYNGAGTDLETVTAGDLATAIDTLFSGLADNDFLYYEAAGAVWKNIVSGATGRALLAAATAAAARTQLGLGTAALKNTGVAAGQIAVNEQNWTALASAATVNIGAASSYRVNITGTTTITAFDTVAAGIAREVRFDGALTLTHNATSLILPGGANITTASGDVATFVSEGSGNWRCVKYEKADGKPVVAQPVQYKYFTETSNVTISTAIPTGTLWSSSQSITIPTAGQIILIPHLRIDNGTGAGKSYAIGLRINGTDYFPDLDNNGSTQYGRIMNSIGASSYMTIRGSIFDDTNGHVPGTFTLDIGQRSISTGIQTVQPIVATTATGAGQTVTGATSTARLGVIILDGS